MSVKKPIIISYDLNCTPKPCIQIYNENLLPNGKTRVPDDGAITFFNGLGKDVEAKITFYASKQGKNANTGALTDFCVGQTGTEFVVTNLRDCVVYNEVDQDTHFFYSVAAGEEFQDLDPVIIIEPGTASLNVISPVIAAVALLIAAGAAFLVGKSFGGRKD
ncbi:MAG: hypothetical protein HKN70_00545 [Gammaproteobacteria bacterium]|nr:hypothetical protein [Gammaproteobacteria bacterium]